MARPPPISAPELRLTMAGRAPSRNAPSVAESPQNQPRRSLTMKLEVRLAFTAASAATAAAEAASKAQAMIEAGSAAWELADQAYWLCRAAQKAAENSANVLDPEAALDDDTILYAHMTALAAAQSACSAADELVTLAMENEHIIRR